MNKSNIPEESSEHQKPTKTREDKLLNWLENQNKKDYQNTEKIKREFINEIKNDFGSQIKDKNSHQPKKIKINRLIKMLRKISKLFDVF